MVIQVFSRFEREKTTFNANSDEFKEETSWPLA
jgi:hypothetical protein